MKLQRALVILKQTPYARLVGGGKAEKAHLRRLLEVGDGAVQQAHAEHVASLEQVRDELRTRGIPFRESEKLPARPITGVDLVICIGGDGTLLAASHGVRSNIPVMGVNSAPAFSVGFLTCCRAPTFAQTLDDFLGDRLSPLRVQRLRVRIGRKLIPEPVLNDVLFCHENPAITTRYRLIVPEGEEEQRSSGAWISTPAGSTAALRSAGGQELPLTAERFAYVVREPYAPPGSSVRFRGGVLERGQQLAMHCHVPSANVYLDGSHRQYAVPFGQRVIFSLDDHPLLLVPPRGRS